MAIDAASSRARGLLGSRARAEEHLRTTCFRLGPPRLIGVELEWLTARADATASRPELATLVEALGPHAPRTVAPTSSARPLPSGSSVTIEPGGQVELSSVPCASARQVCDRLNADIRMLRALLARRSVTMVESAADEVRPPHRLLRTPRYGAMELRYDSIGPMGRLMMNSTAAVQVSVDAGMDEADVARRWELLHAIGPAMVAAFAFSPQLRGVPEGDWVSQRMRTWLELDPGLGRPGSPAEYPSWVVDAPLTCVRSSRSEWHVPPGATFANWLAGDLDDDIGRRPTFDDLDYHRTTLFPPVRACGHLEVRYIDAQPGDLWQVPVAAVEALLGTREVGEEALAIVAPVRDRWEDAARIGLGCFEMRAAAAGVLSLAAEASRDMRFTTALDAAAARCLRGRAPESDSR